MAFEEPPVLRSDLLKCIFSIYYRIDRQRQVFRYCSLLCVTFFWTPLVTVCSWTAADWLLGLGLTCYDGLREGCPLKHVLCTARAVTWFERSVLDFFFYEVHVTMSVTVGPANPAAFQLCNYWKCVQIQIPAFCFYVCSLVLFCCCFIFFCSWLS